MDNNNNNNNNNTNNNNEDNVDNEKVESKALTKNQKRKEKKKRKLEKMKVNGELLPIPKKKSVKSVEFVYDHPTAQNTHENSESPSTIQEKTNNDDGDDEVITTASSSTQITNDTEKTEKQEEQEQQQSEIEDSEGNGSSSKNVLLEETKEKTPLTKVEERNPINPKYLPVIQKLRENALISRYAELKEFFSTIVDVMKATLDLENDDEFKRFNEVDYAFETFFLLLEQREFPEEVIKRLIVLKRKLLSLDYREAQMEYFALTVGRTPWPTVKSTFRILESEVKRKIFQAIKRVITFFMETIAPENEKVSLRYIK